jgi:hypothetical protein
MPPRFFERASILKSNHTTVPFYDKHTSVFIHFVADLLGAGA